MQRTPTRLSLEAECPEPGCQGPLDGDRRSGLGGACWGPSNRVRCERCGTPLAFRGRTEAEDEDDVARQRLPAR